MNKKISIVFPVYNEEDVIKSLVDKSVYLLDEMPCEYQILIVNNASTDKTGEIIEELAGKHPAVNVV